MCQRIMTAALMVLVAAQLAWAQVPGGIPLPGEPSTIGDPAPQKAEAAHQAAPAQPRFETERSVAETNPSAAPPPAGTNMPLSNVDGRTVAVYSILWLLAIALAITAILRAESTDRYHDHEHKTA
jgi:hypothetical protein